MPLSIPHTAPSSSTKRSPGSGPGYIDFVQAPLVIYRMLVRLHNQQGNFVEVLSAYQSYTWTLLTAEPPDLRQTAEALTLARRAVELSEQATPVEQAARLDTLAVAYHLTGEHTRAIDIAEQALGLVPPAATEAGAHEVRQELESHLATFRAARQQAGSR